MGGGGGYQVLFILFIRRLETMDGDLISLLRPLFPIGGSHVTVSADLEPRLVAGRYMFKHSPKDGLDQVLAAYGRKITQIISIDKGTVQPDL